jgi:hypothetical protein
MAIAPFGNDPKKVDNYLKWWNRESVPRPMICFTMVGWFPLEEFSACQAWGDARHVELDMIKPQDFMDDHLRLLKEGEIVEDDVFRGAYPGMLAIPWLPPMMGTKLRLLPSSIMGEELNLSLEEALAQSTLNLDSPWWHKYLDFALALVKISNGRFPIGHGSEIGPTDLHAVFRGHTQSIMDLMVDPGPSKEIMWRMGEVFRDMAKEYWKHIPLFEGGYFDCQYHIWSPGSIIRLQEDATAVYSPTLYRELVMDVDRLIAQSFDNTFIHLHSTSMFLLDAILEIEEIKGFEINYEDSGPSMVKMIPYFRMVQDEGRSLLVRGSFTSDELRMLSDELSAAGLYIQLIVRDLAEVEKLRPLVGM